MEETLEQTAQITSRRSFLGVLKLTIKRRFFMYTPAFVGQNVYVHSGHIHVSFSFFYRNFLLNNGIDK